MSCYYKYLAYPQTPLASMEDGGLLLLYNHESVIEHFIDIPQSGRDIPLKYRSVQ